MSKKNGNKDIIIKAFEENGFTIPADKTDDFITAIVYEFETAEYEIISADKDSSDKKEKFILHDKQNDTYETIDKTVLNRLLTNFSIHIVDTHYADLQWQKELFEKILELSKTLTPEKLVEVYNSDLSENTSLLEKEEETEMTLELADDILSSLDAANYDIYINDDFESKDDMYIIHDRNTDENTYGDMIDVIQKAERIIGEIDTVDFNKPNKNPAEIRLYNHISDFMEYVYPEAFRFQSETIFYLENQTKEDLEKTLNMMSISIILPTADFGTLKEAVWKLSQVWNEKRAELTEKDFSYDDYASDFLKKEIWQLNWNKNKKGTYTEFREVDNLTIVDSNSIEQQKAVINQFSKQYGINIDDKTAKAFLEMINFEDTFYFEFDISNGNFVQLNEENGITDVETMQGMLSYFKHEIDYRLNPQENQHVSEEMKEDARLLRELTESIETGIHVNYAFTEEITKEHGEIYSKIEGIDRLVIYEEPRWSFKDPENNIVMDYLKEHDSNLYEEIKAYIKKTGGGYYFDIGKSLRYDDCSVFSKGYDTDFSKETINDKLDNFFIVRYSSDDDDGNMGDGGEGILIQDVDLELKLNSMIKEHVQQNIEHYTEFKKLRNEYIDKELADHFNNAIELYNEKDGILKSADCPEKLDSEHHLIRLQEGQLTTDLEVLLGLKTEGDVTHNFGWFKYAELDKDGVLVYEYPVNIWDERQDSKGNRLNPEKIDIYKLEDLIHSEEIINKIEKRFKEELNKEIQRELKDAFEHKVREGIFSDFDSEKVLESLEKESFDEFENVGKLKIGSCDFNLYLGFAAEEPNIFISPVKTKDGKEINGYIGLSLTQIKDSISFRTFEDKIKDTIISKIDELDSPVDTKKTIYTALDRGWYISDEPYSSSVGITELRELLNNCGFKKNVSDELLGVIIEEMDERWARSFVRDNEDGGIVLCELSSDGKEYQIADYDVIKNVISDVIEDIGEVIQNGSGLSESDIAANENDIKELKELISENTVENQVSLSETSLTSRANIISGKTELNSEELYQLVELKHEYSSEHKLEKFTDKEYSSLNSEEKNSLIENLLKADYLKYKNCYIARSKLLYDTSETLAKEIAIIDKLDNLGYQVYLLPYGYARDSMNCFLKSADSITNGDFLEFKTVISTGKNAGQSVYRDSRKQANNVFISLLNETSEDKVVNNIYSSIREAKRNENKCDFEGLVFLNFEKDNDRTVLYSFDKEGFAIRLDNPTAAHLKEFRGLIAESPVLENPMTEHSSSPENNIQHENTSVNKNTVLTWDELYDKVGNGDLSVKIQDNARAYVSGYAKEHFGIDIENAHIPEEAIESFFKEHPELNRFNKDGQLLAEIEKSHPEKTLEPFEHASFEMYFDEKEKKWNALLRLQNKDTVNLSFEASENDLEDFWYGFKYNGHEYDMNICNGGDYGNGGWIYPVGPDGHTNTVIDVELDAVNIYSKERGNLEVWTWKDYDDLSGHLVAPDGKSYFSYDWTTKEYKFEEESGYESFIDADPDRATTLDAFKSYAQDYIRKHFIKDKVEEIIFAREYIDIEKMIEEDKKKEIQNETIEQKKERLKVFFTGVTTGIGPDKESTFEQVVAWQKENNLDRSEGEYGILLDAVSRMVLDNVDFGSVDYRNFDDVYGFDWGASVRYDVSDTVAKDILSGNILDINEVQGAVYSAAEKKFEEIKNNPIHKIDIEIIDRINAAFRISQRLYPEYAELYEHDVPEDDFYNYSISEKKAYIEKVWESLKTAFDNKKVHFRKSSYEFTIAKDGENKTLFCTDFALIIKGRDAALDGEKSLSYKRPTGEQIGNGFEFDWDFGVITTGYAEFGDFITTSDFPGREDVINIEKIDDMNVFKSDLEAGEQYGIDHNVSLFKERESIWFGEDDYDREYFVFPDTAENRKVLKPFLIDIPVKENFDWSEFTEKDFELLKSNLDNPDERMYGSVHIGSISCDLQYRGEKVFDLDFYVLGEKGIGGEIEFGEVGIPYSENAITSINLDEIKNMSYEEFQEYYQNILINNIEAEHYCYEAGRPTVNWSDEKQCKELYRTKLIESARLNQIVIAPYTHDEEHLRDVEIVRQWLSDSTKLPVESISDKMVYAVIDNIGRPQDDKPGDFLQVHKDGTVLHISADGKINKDPAKIFNIIYSFAEEHAAGREYNSEQEKDFDYIKFLNGYIDSNRYSHLDGINAILKEQLEKEAGITIDDSLVDEIVSRYEERELSLNPLENGLFRSFDVIDKKYTNPFPIQDAVKQVISWDDKELSELHAGTADDEEIAKIKGYIEELERVDEQITYNNKITGFDCSNKEHAQKIINMLGEAFKITLEEAQTLLTYATHFDDGTNEYGFSEDGHLYFRTNQDDEGWSFITEDSMDKDFLTSAFDGAAIFLESDRVNDIQNFNSFLRKNRVLLNVLDENNFYISSLNDFNEKLNELFQETNDIESGQILVTESVTFPCGFTFPKEIYENDQGGGKREEYRWKIYDKIKEKYGFNDNDTETQYFEGSNPSEDSFNIHFAVSVPEEIKSNLSKVNEWIADIENFVKEECGCTFINWQGGERLVTVQNNKDIGENITMNENESVEQIEEKLDKELLKLLNKLDGLRIDSDKENEKYARLSVVIPYSELKNLELFSDRARINPGEGLKMFICNDYLHINESCFHIDLFEYQNPSYGGTDIGVRTENLKGHISIGESPLPVNDPSVYRSFDIYVPGSGKKEQLNNKFFLYANKDVIIEKTIEACKQRQEELRQKNEKELEEKQKYENNVNDIAGALGLTENRSTAKEKKLSFTDDIDKMRDFDSLSKEEFLSSYSYLTEEEYDATAEELKSQNLTGLHMVKVLSYKEAVNNKYHIYDNRIEKTDNESEIYQAAIERLTDISLEEVAGELDKTEDEVIEIISTLINAKDFVEGRFDIIRPTVSEIKQELENGNSWTNILKTEVSPMESFLFEPAGWKAAFGIDEKLWSRDHIDDGWVTIRFPLRNDSPLLRINEVTKALAKENWQELCLVYGDIDAFEKNKNIEYPVQIYLDGPITNMISLYTGPCDKYDLSGFSDTRGLSDRTKTGFLECCKEALKDHLCTHHLGKTIKDSFFTPKPEIIDVLNTEVSLTPSQLQGEKFIAELNEKMPFHNNNPWVTSMIIIDDLKNNHPGEYKLLNEYFAQENISTRNDYLHFFEEKTNANFNAIETAKKQQMKKAPPKASEQIKKEQKKKTKTSSKDDDFGR